MERMDPLRNFNFIVEIDGIHQAGFTDVSGFGATVDPVEYHEGGKVPYMRKLPGMTKYNNITLKWGLTTNCDLYNWFEGIVNGQIMRKDVSLIVYDIDGATERARWIFHDCWPTKWSGGDFTAKSSEIAIDTLELAVEWVERR